MFQINYNLYLFSNNAELAISQSMFNKCPSCVPRRIPTSNDHIPNFHFHQPIENQNQSKIIDWILNNNNLISDEIIILSIVVGETGRSRDWETSTIVEGSRSDKWRFTVEFGKRKWGRSRRVKWDAMFEWEWIWHGRHESSNWRTAIKIESEKQKLKSGKRRGERSWGMNLLTSKVQYYTGICLLDKSIIIEVVSNREPRVALLRREKKNGELDKMKRFVCLCRLCVLSKNILQLFQRFSLILAIGLTFSFQVGMNHEIMGFIW